MMLIFLHTSCCLSNVAMFGYLLILILLVMSSLTLPKVQFELASKLHLIQIRAHLLYLGKPPTLNLPRGSILYRPGGLFFGKDPPRSNAGRPNASTSSL